MIDKIITGYITANRRLVIPEFGAFIRKDDNSVVFVPFLKKDDGVLKELITRSLSVSATEAVQMLDEYVLCIKQRLLHREGYIIEGLGQLKSDANGIFYLDYDPSIAPRPGADRAVQGSAAQAEAKTGTGEVQGRKDGASCELGSPASQAKEARTGHNDGQKPSVTQPVAPPTTVRSVAEVSAPGRAANAAVPSAAVTAAASAQPMAQGIRQQAGQATDQVGRQPAIKAATQPGEQTGNQPAIKAATQPATFQKQPARPGQSRNNIVKTDKFIAIAIIAAIIAIAAIIYGILANPTPDIEIVIDPAQNAVEAPETAPGATTPAK